MAKKQNTKQEQKAQPEKKPAAAQAPPQKQAVAAPAAKAKEAPAQDTKKGGKKGGKKMSFLLGDAYGSSSSSDDESEHELEAVRLAPAPQENDDSAAAVLLPSADSVLADVSASTASFLAPKSAQSAAAAAIVEIDIFKENERAKARQAAERAAERQSRRDGFASSSEVAKKRARAALEADEKEPPAKKDKKDAKERVKAQRTKGQAGIGSDFRSWKSETEMSMRQQFD